MEWTKGGFKLSSGREVYANRQIVGINHTLDVHEGYDGTLWLRHDKSLFEGNTPLTHEERQEIADETCRLWKLWAAKEGT